MTEAGEPPYIQARLVPIYFPGVKVEHKRPSLPVDGAQSVSAETVREKPEKATTSNWKSETRHLDRAYRELRQLITFTGGQAMGPAWRAGHAIAVVMHWKDGGIPGKPLLGKDIQRPTRLIGNGVARRAIPCYRRTENVLKNHLRSPGFFFKNF